MFPKFESHYSRRDTKKLYLHPDLDTEKMYSLYKEKCKEDGRKIASHAVYYKIFQKKNLSFKQPYVDTCALCDEYKMKLRNKNLQDEEKSKICLEREAHLKKVDIAFETKANDKEAAKNSAGKIVVRAFDLQKVLETPSLTTGNSFYKRQLSTYNLTIHDLATNKASSYLWYECIGGRGSDEIASVLFLDIKKLNDDVEKIIYYSDNCTGQNHNFTLPVMYTIALQEKRNLKAIEHKFLVAGHTRMECDSDHARIEKAKPKEMEIFIPRDWYNMIRLIKRPRGGPYFETYEMKLEDFIDFKCFYNANTSVFIKRTKFDNGENVEWSKNRYIHVEKENPNVISLSLDIDKPNFRQLEMCRRKKNNTKKVQPLLKAKNKTRMPISTKKYNNLKELLRFIPEEYHTFYLNLPHSNRKADDQANDMELE